MSATGWVCAKCGSPVNEWCKCLACDKNQGMRWVEHGPGKIVERVARAIYEGLRESAPWNDAHEGARVIYRQASLAAIAAMRAAIDEALK